VGGSAQIKAMRSVAGTLRLNLAQFRELEAFAQFGSDLDAATQAQLKRGARLVEILKQGQYAPLSVQKQVAIIYVATQGLVDDIPTTRMKAFEEGFLSYLDANASDILEEILKTKVLSDETKTKINRAVETFKKTFKA
jgi:F-type H+-transporting ATPase subunit alpha